MTTACAPTRCSKPFEGVDPQPGAALQGDRERLGARGDRPLHERDALRGLRRLPAEARGAGREDRRPAHRRGLGSFPCARPQEWFGALSGKLNAEAERDRRPHPQGDPRAADLPGRCRPGIPDARARLRHACRAARASASGSPRRSARASPACSMCWTSPRSACTSATTSACSRRCGACATSATRVIVVEHDEDAILQADYVVDVGPGAGIHGGEIVAQGTPAEIMANREVPHRQISHGRPRGAGARRSGASRRRGGR